MKSINVRLLYIIYNENLLHNGILRGQVIKLIEQLSQRNEIEEICILSFVNPMSLIKSRLAWRSLSSSLKSKGIRLKLSPMFFPVKWKFITTLLSLVHCLPILMITLLLGRFNVIHTRSYTAGLLGHLAQLLTGKIHIFDPRGPLPEEMVLNEIWLEGSYTFKFWKYIEQRIIMQSSSVVAVTPGWKKQFRRRGARKSVFIPNRADFDYFYSESISKPIPPKPIFLSIGEMNSYWNRPELVSKVYLRLKHKIPDLHLRLITRMEADFIQQKLSMLHINDNDWSLESFSPEEIPGKISGSSFGYITAKWHPDGNWPVKMAEYLACGIPLAVDEGADSAITNLVEKWDLGIVIRDNDESYLQKAVEIVDNMPEYRDRCRWFAKKYLDISRSADQYLRLYMQELRQK